MTWANLTEDVEAIFDAFMRMPDFSFDILRHSLTHNDDGDRAHLVGAHVLDTRWRAPRGFQKTSRKAARDRAFAAKSDGQDTARRILAGEVPQALISGRGRTPKRWLRVAAELGVDLQARAATVRAQQGSSKP